jgi:hypothetical protein
MVLCARNRLRGSVRHQKTIWGIQLYFILLLNPPNLFVSCYCLMSMDQRLWRGRIANRFGKRQHVQGDFWIRNRKKRQHVQGDFWIRNRKLWCMLPSHGWKLWHLVKITAGFEKKHKGHEMSSKLQDGATQLEPFTNHITIQKLPIQLFGTCFVEWLATVRRKLQTCLYGLIWLDSVWEAMFIHIDGWSQRQNFLWI